MALNALTVHRQCCDHGADVDSSTATSAEVEPLQEQSAATQHAAQRRRRLLLVSLAASLALASTLVLAQITQVGDAQLEADLKPVGLQLSGCKPNVATPGWSICSRKSCSNRDDSSFMLGSVRVGVTLERCLQKCKDTKDCYSINFQPVDCPSGDGVQANACYLFRTGCQAVENSCWDYYAPDVPGHSPSASPSTSTHPSSHPSSQPSSLPPVFPPVPATPNLPAWLTSTENERDSRLVAPTLGGDRYIIVVDGTKFFVGENIIIYWHKSENEHVYEEAWIASITDNTLSLSARLEHKFPAGTFVSVVPDIPPTAEPTFMPTLEPTPSPTAVPTLSPTPVPTPEPTNPRTGMTFLTEDIVAGASRIHVFNACVFEHGDRIKVISEHYGSWCTIETLDCETNWIRCKETMQSAFDKESAAVLLMPEGVKGDAVQDKKLEMHPFPKPRLTSTGAAEDQLLFVTDASDVPVKSLIQLNVAGSPRQMHLVTGKGIHTKTALEIQPPLANNWPQNTEIEIMRVDPSATYIVKKAAEDDDKVYVKDAAVIAPCDAVLLGDDHTIYYVKSTQREQVEQTVTFYEKLKVSQREGTILVKDQVLTQLMADATAGTKEIWVQHLGGFAKGDIVRISGGGNEETGDIASPTGQSPIELSQELQFSYNYDATLTRINPPASDSAGAPSECTGLEGPSQPEP